ncbi:Fanconi anaemia protein FANCD2 [Pilobolus umbonatus]|nr:Fanconi anaemia protein FANCD2 [Pilobolus umbonatus]
MSIVEKLIGESGCQLNTNPVSFVVEPVLFRRKLGLLLRTQIDSVDTFIEELETYIEDPAALRRFLLPAKVVVDVQSSRYDFQRDFLSSMMNWRMSNTEHKWLSVEISSFLFSNSESSSCTARLILHQLRWLDYIIEPEMLTEKLIEHEIITSLPDIMNDSEHKHMVVYLKELMDENSALTVPILDALSNLTSHSENLDDIRDIVIDRLELADIDDLAIIVKFMLQTVTQQTIDLVIAGIRDKLDFRALGKLQQIDNNYSSQRKAFKVIDILVIIILYSMPSTKKKIEQIVKKKMTMGCITTQLLQETIVEHANGLSKYWNTILALAECLLRSSQQNSLLASCANTLYYHSFKASDSYYRQEIVGLLVTHIGSGVSLEMNIALNIILQLTKSKVSDMAIYSVFIKGILDYLDNLSLSQVRTLFDIFSMLALMTGSSNDGSANLWSEIQIVIRKQLSNPRERYKNIGVIASLSSVKVLGSTELCQDQIMEGSSSLASRSSVAPVTKHPYLKQATNLLDLTVRNCKEHPSCIALLYDELADMFTNDNLDHRLIEWIKDNMTSDFTEFYLSAIEDIHEYITLAENDNYSRLYPEILLNIDGEEAQIGLILYQLLYRVDIKKKKELLIPMCSMFNLLQSCEKKLNDRCLTGLDALFGCGITLFSKELDDLSDEDIDSACDMLFFTISWLRELLNSFVFSEDNELKQKLTVRLKNILELESLLIELMKRSNNYVPLEFHTLSNTYDELEGHSQMVTTEDNSSFRPVRKESKMNAIRFSSIAELRPYMRPFRVHIFEILKYNGENKLNYSDINYLLEDLNHKLDIKIVPVTAPKKKGTMEDKCISANAHLLGRTHASSLVKEVVSYLPLILDTLETHYADLQSQGYEDLALGVSYIFSILQKLISWPEINSSENEPILKEFIHILSQRISDDISGKYQPLQVELTQAFHYLSQYCESIPQAQTAISLFNALQGLKSLSENSSEMKEDALRVVNTLLGTDWFDWRDIKKDISLLVEQSVELSDTPLEVLHTLVNNILPQFEEEGSIEEYPLLKNDTIVHYFQAIINQAVNVLDLLKDNDQETDVRLVQNARIVKIFERITVYVKLKEQRIFIGMLLKTGRLFIENFTRHSIPYFTGIFKLYKSEILAIFKDFQMSTRALQVICSHVKVLKDVTLSGYVPPLKKALETVIFQVKILMTENRLSTKAFYLGALKHRDIRGVEVSSQIPRDMDEDSPGEENSQLTDMSTEENEAPQPPVKPVVKRKKVSEVEKKQSQKKRKKSGILTSHNARTSSVVPSSSEEEEEEEEERVQHKRSKMSIIQSEAEDDEEEEEEERVHHKSSKMSIIQSEAEDDEEEEEEEVLFEYKMNTDDEENQPEKKPSPARKRLGIGKSIKSSQKVFNLTSRNNRNPE